MEPLQQHPESMKAALQELKSLNVTWVNKSSELADDPERSKQIQNRMEYLRDWIVIKLKEKQSSIEQPIVSSRFPKGGIDYDKYKLK